MTHSSSTSPSAMERKEFMQTFSGVYEHSPWIAERVWEQGLCAEDDTLDGLCERFREVVTNATHDQQLVLICAHPDLAGKAAQRGDLTMESKTEQATAGIDQCTKEEYALFEGYNAAYKKKYGFPFVMAVKGSNKLEILAAFKARLDNTYDIEFSRALQEINKIARVRLSEILELK